MLERLGLKQASCFKQKGKRGDGPLFKGPTPPRTRRRDGWRDDFPAGDLFMMPLPGLQWAWWEGEQVATLSRKTCLSRTVSSRDGTLRFLTCPISLWAVIPRPPLLYLCNPSPMA